MRHLSTMGREISNSHQFEHWYCQCNVWAKLISRPFTLNMFKQVEQFITSVYKMQCINLGFVFLSPTLIALNLRAVIANQRPNIIINLPLFIYLFFCNLAKVHLIWQGGMKILKLKAWNFSSPPPPSLVVQHFRSHPLLLVLKYTNFRSPPPSPTFFSEPPFRVSKNFWSPPPSISSSPLVILNELSLILVIS